ncbi:hypothetical protein BS47DRAFT_1392726 [Hydnum rufescens UP504]|uniref:AB hydrolase-1 domain-containing protein n=1 Tax=Hydnum rufescens UP504 TaxID=1448309 RepID=A0A9P6DWV2_9AGAM|nr:hypothetical protein BS47DRAFT_1392726 [Hydnum rufescens UP504]
MSSIPSPRVPIDVPPPSRKLRDIPSAVSQFDRYPVLPCPPRSPHFIPGYSVTTHVIPGAYPRQSFHELRRYPNLAPISSIPPPVEAKAEREAWAVDTCSKMKGKRHAIVRMRVQGQRSGAPRQHDSCPVLWNVVNRYARIQAHRGRKDMGITLVVAHAIGLHKESWEAMIKHLISLCDNIDEAWAIDSANSGDSALLNEKYLEDVFDWADHVRDALNLMENFIPEGPFVASPYPLPVNLDRVSSDCASRRRKFGFHHRNVLGIGHSMGACILTSAACANPNLFQSLTLIDPMILPNGRNRVAIDNFVIRPLLRRQSWPSREQAKAHLLRSSSFKSWDPEVLDAYVQYALTDIPWSEGGGVRLKMRAFQEAVESSDHQFPEDTYQTLGGLDKKVNLRWIMPVVPMNGDPPEYRESMVWRRPANSSNVTIDLGHLMVQIAPLVLANEVLHGWQIMHGNPMWSRL